MMTHRPGVLISAVSAPYNKPFLPYIWALLKTHWDRHGAPGAFEWLPPIVLNDEPEALLRPYDLRAIDVLGLSCYTWNFRVQCAIARRVKAESPGTLVVAGGPEPDCKDGLFFSRHPYIDAVVTKDGEVTFSSILAARLGGADDLSHVPGLYLPEPGGDSMRYTGAPETPRSFDESPYIAQSAYFERLRTALPEFHASWETNRGCPYSCSFCDWGSSTMSKIRRFDMARVKAEVDWLARMGVLYLISVDANFGILPRDLEIADDLCAAYRRHGYPKLFYYNAAKNNPDRAVAIAAKFAELGLCRSHVLAVQHTHPEVLAATERENISPAKQVEAARTLLLRRIPIDVQLIMGIPGDTYERWSQCLGDLMEWGVHEDYTMFFYNLLPNAPAAEEGFQREWRIGTVDRVVLPDPDHVWVGEPIGPLRTPVSRLVVESRTYSRRDWVRMCTYGAVVKALHCGGLTRLVAMYLRWTHGVPYVDFYRDLVERFVETEAPFSAYYGAVRRSFTEFLEVDGSIEFMRLDRVPSYPYAMDASRWIFVNACMDFDACAAALRAYLPRRYPGAAPLRSLLDYQLNLVIRPDYDRRAGACFATDHDWVEYFSGARGRTGAEGRPEPAHRPGAVVRITDTHAGDELGRRRVPLSWETLEGEARWHRWVQSIVEQRHSAATRHFQQVSLEQPAVV